MHNLLITLTIMLLIAILPLSTHAARQGDKNLGWPGTTLEGAACWGNEQGYGPFDYATTPRGAKHLRIVESHHFTPEVEKLIRGKNSKFPDGDLDYTLRAFPNHHRALWAMSKFYLKSLKTLDRNHLLALARSKGYPPPECYFNRALLFAPEDATSRVVYGIYLHRRNEFDAALEQYSIAERNQPKNAELMYNIGLLHLDMGNVAQAKSYADRAEELGYPLTGLHRKIRKKEATLANSSAAGQ